MELRAVALHKGDMMWCRTRAVLVGSLVVIGVTLGLAKIAVAQFFPAGCPGRWVSVGYGSMCLCPDGSFAAYIGGRIVCPNSYRPRYRPRRVCRVGYYPIGGKCVKQGYKPCKGQNFACPKDKKCIPGGCAPKDASACPSGKGRFCKAPLTCAVGLDGKEACFSAEGIRLLRVEQGRRLRARYVARRDAHRNAVAAAFRKRHGKSYREWLAFVRQLAIVLRSAGENSAAAQQARDDMRAAFAGVEKPLPTLPEGTGVDIGAAGIRNRPCAGLFERSELWDEGYILERCTRRGWAIARRIDEAGNALATCAAVDPKGRMTITLEAESQETAATVRLANLKAREWALGAEDQAAVSFAVDGQRFFEGRLKVLVSDTPPLRYGFVWHAGSRELEALIRGNRARARIEKLSWPVSLRGSAAAIRAASACARSTGP